ncbi:MAG: invasion associated locus B family protein [Hyphomicrobiaceae bacterium]|nr:invasion associated locus B family protein [Hyphomicrobiaceae bacterium]
MANSGWLARGAGCAVTGMAVAFGLQIAASGLAVAQQTKSQPKAAPPAAAQKKQAPEKGAQQAPQSAWVKLCEKADLARRGKDGKEEREQKNICLTHHERLDGNTGMVLVSAAIREVEGMDKEHLMIMVPLGMAIPPGIKAAVYTKEQWEKAQKNEKIDEQQLKPIALHYSLCHPAGCTAEVEATKELVDSMKTGGGLMVLAINANAQPIAFPVPLDGFTTAHSGAPIDNKAYAQARGQLMQQIRQRQAELIKQHQEKQKQQQPAPAAAAEKKK